MGVDIFTLVIAQEAPFMLQSFLNFAQDVRHFVQDTRHLCAGCASFCAGYTSSCAGAHAIFLAETKNALGVSLIQASFCVRVHVNGSRRCDIPSEARE